MRVLREVTFADMSLRKRTTVNERKTVTASFFIVDICLYLRNKKSKGQEFLEKEAEILSELMEFVKSSGGIYDIASFFEYKNEKAPTEIRKYYNERKLKVREMFRSLNWERMSRNDQINRSQQREDMVTRLSLEENAALQEAREVRCDILLVFDSRPQQEVLVQLELLVKKLISLYQESGYEDFLCYPYQSEKEESWKKINTCSEYCEYSDRILVLKDWVKYTIIDRIMEMVENNFLA